MKKKKYSPKPVDPFAHWVALMGVQKMSVDDVLRAVLPVDVAVDEARKGTINKQGWQAIFNAINMIEAFIKMKIVADEDGAHEHLQETVAQILDRAKNSGTKTLYAEEINTLIDLRATYAQVLSVITQSQFFDAEEIVRKRLASVVQSNPPKGVYIISER